MVNVTFSWWHIIPLIAAPVAVAIILGWIKIPSRLAALEVEIKNLRDLIKPVYDKIVAKQFSTPGSPKQITQMGKEVLRRHNIDDFLNSCSLVQDVTGMRNKEGLDIFISCLEWVDENAKKKITEIIYENDISHEQCRELLALALRDEILNKIKKS